MPRQTHTGTPNVIEGRKAVIDPRKITNDIQIKKVPKDTYWEGRPAEKIRYGVNHYVSARYVPGYERDPYNIDGIMQVFTTYATRYKFSCHYVVCRDGKIYHFVDLAHTAYHAGRSISPIPPNEVNLNGISVGVEYVGDDEQRFTRAQYEAGGRLTAYIEDEVEKRKLGRIDHWVGHDWIAGELAVKVGLRRESTKKIDPGPLFDWPYWRKNAEKARQEVLQYKDVNDLTFRELVSAAVRRISPWKKR